MALHRYVFEIIVVKHEDGSIIHAERITAASTESAMAKVGLKEVCEKNSMSTDDVEFIILKLGELRPVEEVKTTEIKNFS